MSYKAVAKLAHHKHQKDEQKSLVVEIRIQHILCDFFSRSCGFMILFVVVFGLWRVSPMVMWKAAIVMFVVSCFGDM